MKKEPKTFEKHSYLYSTVVIASLSLLTAGCGRNVANPALQNQQSSTSSSDYILQKNNYPSNTINDRVNLYLRLLQHNGGNVQEYIDFLKHNPTWPNQTLLQKRMQDALLLETNQTIIAETCQNQPITISSALVFCAQEVKHTANLDKQARSAWINSIKQSNDEQQILSIFGEQFTSKDQWNRFNHLEFSGTLSAATRQVNRLANSQRNLALTRLAFRKGQITAEDLLKTLDKDQLRDEGLIYDRLRWLRLQMRDDEAFQLWREAGLSIEKETNRPIFWNERNALIRDLINQEQYKNAYNLADPSACNNQLCKMDSAFLAGWIALQRLHQPEKAIRYFQELTNANSVLTLSRGYYWLGRTHEAMQNHSAALNDWRQAAKWPTTYYGQMAIALLNNQSESILLGTASPASFIAPYLNTIQEPSWSNAAMASFKLNELIQAAQILVNQDDRTHARAFLIQYNRLYNDPTNQAMNAYFANQLGMPEDAVAIARNAGSKGIILLKNGWPTPYSPPTSDLPAELILALMRQESGFDADIVSPANAYGLMQLLPSTARLITQKSGLPSTLSYPNNLINPQNNMRLGTIYLNQIVTRFNHVIPYAIAAYNAGPRRVDQWIATNSSSNISQNSTDQFIDWIELIPFNETRNYVQRVIENKVIYQSINVKN